MIKTEELREFRPVYRFENGNGITLEGIQTELENVAKEKDVPVAFYLDKVKGGTLFNKQIEDGLVLYHPEHKNDYYKLCIRVQRQGNVAFIYVNDFGNSKQSDKFAKAEGAREDRRGKPLSYKIGSFIGSLIHNIGKSRQKLEEENNYYAALMDILDEVIS